MAAFNFPNSPSTNDLHTENGVTYKWNGTVWKRQNASYTDATNLNVTGIATFVNNVSIGGVLTYEDVKNVDSIGIVTARGGLNVTANTDTDTLNVSGISTLGSPSANNTTFINSSTAANSEATTLVVGHGSGNYAGMTFQCAANYPGAVYFTDTDTGKQGGMAYYHIGDELRLYAGETQKMALNSDGTTINNGSLFVADKITHNGDTNTHIRFPAADTITAETGGTERLRITSTGEVGIGIDDPYYPLDVRFSSSTTALSGGGGGDWGGLGLRLQNNNTTVGSMSLIHFRSGDNADWHIGTKFVGTGDSDIVFLQEGVNEKLRIKNDGKIGIGTITPGDLVHINTTGNVGGIRFGNGQNLNAGTIRSNWNSIDLIAEQNLTFQTNSNTRMKITNSGSVGIGTITPRATYLHVGNAGNTPGSVFSTSPLSVFATGNLGGTQFDDNKIAIFGGQSTGNVSGLSLYYYRRNTGTDWTTDGFSLRQEVDNTAKIYDYMNFAQGKVGIGTNVPGYKLHVSESTSAVARFERTGGAWAKVDIKAGSSSGNSYLTFSDTDASEVGAINYEHGDNSLRFETYDGSNKQLRAVLDTSGNFYVADQPSFSIRTSDANSFGTSSAHFSLSYASPIPIFTSGNTTTEHHVGSVLTYHDYVAGSNTGRYVKFTAPVAGNYLFGINAECNVAADDWVGFGFEINNTGTHNATLERLVAWTHNQSAEDGTAQARRRSFQGSCLIRLAASDYVVPYQQSSGTSTMQNTFRVWGMLVN